MAAGDSIVSIYNVAMIALGEDLVVSPTDNTKRRIVCTARYDGVRRRVLRGHPWNCATKRGVLAADPVGPAFGYATAYPLPSDCLRVIDIPGRGLESYVVEGNQVLTDMGGALNLKYVFDLQDPTAMDPELIEAIGLALAEEVAPSLTQSDSKQAQVAKRSANAVEDGKATGSQENSPREWDEDIWLRSRQ